MMLLAPLGAKAESAKTLVQGPVLRADGSVAHTGTVTVEWKDFTTAEGEFVFAGRKTFKIGSDGLFSMELMPNTGATPSGSFYRVLLNLPGEEPSERIWVVPAVATTTPAAVWAKVVPQEVAQQSVGRDYVDSAVSASADAGEAYVNEKVGGLATVATTGSYNDLLNKPTLTANFAAPGPIGATTPDKVYATASISKSSPAVDLRAYGAVVDGVTDIGPALALAVAAACNSVNSPVVLMPCTGSGCYLDNGTLPSCGNTTVELKLQGNLKLGSTLVQPNAMSLVCDGGALGGGFLPKGPTCKITAPSAHGTLGMIVASGLQSFTPSFSSGTIANLRVGAAVSVIDNVACTITSISRSSANQNNVTATVILPCRIPAGSVATVAGVADGGFNGAPMILSNDYVTGTITWVQSGPVATSSGGTITGVDDDSFETVLISGVSGSNVTATFAHAHNSTAYWGEVGVMAQHSTYTAHHFQGVHVAGAYGAAWWLPHNAEVYLDSISANAVAWPTSIPFEAASSFGWHLTNASLGTVAQYQCSFNCTQTSYPMGLRITSLQGEQDSSGLNIIIDGNTFILGGIKLDTNQLSGLLSRSGGIRLRDVTIEQPVGSGVLIDSRNNEVHAIEMTDVYMQDNFISYPQCLVRYTDPSTSGSLVIINHQLALMDGCTVNHYYRGAISVNGMDTSIGNAGLPTNGHVGTWDDGRTLEAELRSIEADMHPSLIPYATANVGTDPTAWACYGTTCTISTGVLAPDGTATAAQLVNTSGVTPRVQNVLNSYNTATSTGDAIIAGVWCMTDPKDKDNCGRGAWSTYQIASNSAADTFDDGTRTLAFPSNWQSPYNSDYWHPIVSLNFITGAGSATTHALSMYLGGSDTVAVSRYFWQPFFLFIPHAAKPAAWSENQWRMELGRWRQQLLHGHVSPNMVAGALGIGKSYKLYWGSDTNLYRSAAGVVKTDGWLDAGMGIKCAGSAGGMGQVLSSTGGGCQWVDPASGAPGGTTGAIQYNNGSGFGGAVISGVMKGNGTSAPSAAGSSDVVSLFNGGSCSGYLKSNGMCDTPASLGNVVATAATSYSGTAGTNYALLYTPSADGQYRFCANMTPTVAGAGGSFQIQAQFTWAGHTFGGFAPASGGLSVTSQWGLWQGCEVFNADAGTAINWKLYPYTAVSGTPTVAYSISLEKLR